MTTAPAITKPGYHVDSLLISIEVDCGASRAFRHHATRISGKVRKFLLFPPLTSRMKDVPPGRVQPCTKPIPLSRHQRRHQSSVNSPRMGICRGIVNISGVLALRNPPAHDPGTAPRCAVHTTLLVSGLLQGHASRITGRQNFKSNTNCSSERALFAVLISQLSSTEKLTGARAS